MERESISSVTTALIVGGGIGGMAAAIALSERGVKVDIVDLDPEWRVYGAGITITGPTLRAYRRLGLLDAIKAEGAITTKTRLFRYDGTHLHDLDEPVIEEGNGRDHAAGAAPDHAEAGARTGHPGALGADGICAAE